MGKNSDEISMQEAMRLAKSDAGQQLFNLLKEQNGETLNQAMANAASGDYAKVKESLSAMLQSPQVRALMEQFRRNQDG